jgi:hypothetical protein
VDGTDVAALRRGERSRERREALTNHQFREAASLHVGGSLIFRPTHPKMQFTT